MEMEKAVKESKATAAELSKAVKAQSPVIPIPAKELPRIIAGDKADFPKCLKVEFVKKLVIIEFKGEVPNVKNTLNKYTDDLREAFAAAELPGWKAFFIAGGVKFVSTL